MPIFPQGALNTTALSTPDLYIQIVPPGVQLLNGVPTNVGAAVGTAAWGPVGVAVAVSDPGSFQRAFGPYVARKFDLGTFIARAAQEGGAGIYKAVRVTDGTDVAATATVQTNCLTLTSRYTGSGGNATRFAITTGTAPNTYRIVLALPFYGTEAFDNIGGTGAAFWANVASAINNGTGFASAPSKIAIATAGAGTTAPVLGTTTFTGGTDGATGVTVTTLVGSDVTPRKGMYAMRSQGISVAALCDCDDSQTYAAQVAFGLSEGIYMLGVGPSGDTVDNFATTLNTLGIDSYTFKALLGDYERWLDPVLGLTRYISPQAAALGKLVNLAPQYSVLNKPLAGTTGTQRAATGTNYSSAELQGMATGRMDAITNPIPAGNVFGFRFGRNSSSNPVIHGDNYTRMTNYIASTLAAGMGKFVGALQSRRPDDTTRAKARTTLNAFLGALANPPAGEPMIDDFLVTLDRSNNPDNQIALGYMTATVKVVYLSVVEFFVVNLEGGQSVSVQRLASAPLT